MIDKDDENGMSDMDHVLSGLVAAMAENEGVPESSMENLDMSNPAEILKHDSVSGAIEAEENGN